MVVRVMKIILAFLFCVAGSLAAQQLPMQQLAQPALAYPSGGTAGQLSTTTSAPHTSFYVEKISDSNVNASGIWDLGAGSFILRKRSGDSFSAALTAYGQYVDGSGDVVGLHASAENMKNNPSSSIFGLWATAGCNYEIYGDCTGAEVNVFFAAKGARPDHFYVGAYQPAVILNVISEAVGFEQTTPISAGINLGRSCSYGLTGCAAPLHTGIWFGRNSLAPRNPATNLGEAIFINGGLAPGPTAPNAIALADNIFNGIDFGKAKISGAPFAFRSSDNNQISNYTAPGLAPKVFPTTYSVGIKIMIDGAIWELPAWYVGPAPNP